MDKKQTTINILGSCVCRDIFHYDFDNNFVIKSYVSFISPISNNGAPIFKPDEIDINNWEGSSWNKRNVFYDLTKTCFDKFKDEKSDWFIFDVVDIRKELYLFKDSYITEIQTFLDNKSTILEDNSIKKISPFLISNDIINSALDNIVNNILKIYNKNNVIFIAENLCSKYISKSGEICEFKNNDYIKKLKQLINYANEYITKNYCEKLHIIKIDDVLCDENNIWGLSPLHYTKDTYISVLKKINNIIKSNEVQTQNFGITLNSMPPYLKFNNNDFENEKESILLYPKGFLVCDKDDVLISNYFKKINLCSSFYLYYHKDLLIDSFQKNDVKIFVLGLSYFVSPKYKNETTSSNLVDCYLKSEQDFLYALNDLAGRYIVLLIEKDNIKVYPDACGLKPVYYSSTKKCFGSHIDLVNIVCNEPGSDIEKHIEQNKYTFNYAYPANLTKLKNILLLTPNFYLDLSTISVKRFYPNKNKPSYKNLYDVKTKFFDYINYSMTQLLKLNRPICMSLTGGRDSKVTFYSTMQFTDKIFYFTENRDNDIELAKEIADKYKLNWLSVDMNLLNINNKYKAFFEKTISDKIFPKTSKFALKAHFFNYLNFANQNYIHIHSNCAEAGRGRMGTTDKLGEFPYYSNSYSFETFLDSYIYSTCVYASQKLQTEQKEKMKNDQFFVKTIKDYFSFLNQEYVMQFGYNPWDFMYIEQRMGNIMSQTHMHNDATFESLSLTNCRTILELMWSVPEKYINKISLLYNSILNEYDFRVKSQNMGDAFIPSNIDFTNDNYEMVYGGKYICDNFLSSSEKIDFCKNVLKINNTVKWAYITIITSYLDLLDIESAKSYFLDMIKIDNNASTHWTGITIYDNLIKQNKIDTLNNFINDVSMINSQTGWVYKVKAQLLLRIGDIQNACKNLKTAFSLSPSDKWIASLLISTLIKNKDFLSAKDYLINKMNNFSTLDWYHYNLSLILSNQKDYFSAYQELTKIADIESKKEYKELYLKLKTSLE